MNIINLLVLFCFSFISARLIAINTSIFNLRLIAIAIRNRSAALIKLFVLLAAQTWYNHL